MPIDKLFGGTVSLASQALDVLSARQGLIQSNIANLETPGYKPLDIPFAKVMKQAMESQGGLVRTDGAHLPASSMEASVAGRVERSGQPGNLDEEMLKLSKNQLLYQVGTKILGKKFEGMRYIIDEGGK